MQKEVFLVDEANFSEMAERIQGALAEKKASEREIGRASLLFEELFFRVRSMGVEKMRVEKMRVTVQSRLGDLNLRLSFGGEERNPLADVAEFDDDDVEAYSLFFHKETPRSFIAEAAGSLYVCCGFQYAVTVAPPALGCVQRRKV